MHVYMQQGEKFLSIILNFTDTDTETDTDTDTETDTATLTETDTESHRKRSLPAGLRGLKREKNFFLSFFGFAAGCSRGRSLPRRGGTSAAPALPAPMEGRAAFVRTPRQGRKTRLPRPVSPAGGGKPRLSGARLAEKKRLPCPAGRTPVGRGTAPPAGRCGDCPPLCAAPQKEKRGGKPQKQSFGLPKIGFDGRKAKKPDFIVAF